MFCVPWLPSWMSPKPSVEAQAVAQDVSQKIQDYVHENLAQWSTKKDYPVERHFSWNFNWETRKVQVFDHWFTYHTKNAFGGKITWKINHWSDAGKIDLPETLVQSPRLEKDVEREVLKVCVNWGKEEEDVRVSRNGFCCWHGPDPLRVTAVHRQSPQSQ